MQLGTLELNVIHTGDARELSLQIPHSSVDLIYTDPVYDCMEDYEWLAELSIRVLKPEGALLVFASVPQLFNVGGILKRVGLRYVWQNISYITNTVKHRPGKPGKCLYTPILWFDKGASKRKSFMLDVRAVPAFSSPSNYKWSKPPLVISYYMKGMSNAGDVVLDPFCGGGTVPTTAKMLGRNFLAIEAKPEIAKEARARLIQVMPLLEEQMQEEFFNEGFAAA